VLVNWKPFCLFAGGVELGGSPGRRRKVKLFEDEVLEARNEEATREKTPKDSAKNLEGPLTGGTRCFFLKAPESLMLSSSEAVRASALTFAWLENAAMGNPYKNDGVWYAKVYNGGWVSAGQIASSINERARRLNGEGGIQLTRRTVERHLVTLEREGFVKKLKSGNAGLVIAVRVWPAGEPVEAVDNELEVRHACQDEASCVSGGYDMRVGAYIREQEQEQELKQDPEALTLVENPEKEGQLGELWVDPAMWRALRESVAQTVEESLSVPRPISQNAREERCRQPRYERDVDSGVLARTPTRQEQIFG